jgi:TonB family protein
MPNAPIQPGLPATTERRRHARVQPSGLVYLDIGAENGGIVLDLNEVGAGIQAVAPLAVFSKISIRFQLSDSAGRVQTEAQVAWASESRRRVGLHFVNIADEVRAQIRDWLRSQPRAFAETSKDYGVFADPPFADVPLDLAREEWANLPGESGSSEAHARTFDAALNAPGETSSAGIGDTSNAPVRGFLGEIALAKVTNLRETDALDRDADSASIGGGEQRTESESALEHNAHKVERAEVIHWPGIVPVSDSSAEPAALKSTAIPLPTSMPVSAVERPPLSSTLTSPTMPRGGGLWKIAIAVVILAAASFESGRWLGNISAPTAIPRPTHTPVQQTQSRGDSSSQSVVPREPRGSVLRKRRTEHSEANLDSRQVSPLVPDPAPTTLTTRPNTLTARPNTLPSPPALPNTPVLSIDPARASQASPPAPDASAPAQSPGGIVVDGRALTGTDRFNPAHLLYHFDPDYPPEAKQQNIEGTVTLRLSINASGSVDSVRLLSGPPLLVPAAISAVKNWRYLPALLNGEPVKSEQDVSVGFRLPADQ